MAYTKSGIAGVRLMGKEALSLLSTARELSLRSRQQEDMSDCLLLVMRAMALQMQALEILRACNRQTRAFLEEYKSNIEGQRTGTDRTAQE